MVSVLNSAVHLESVELLEKNYKWRIGRSGFLFVILFVSDYANFGQVT